MLMFHSEAPVNEAGLGRSFHSDAPVDEVYGVRASLWSVCYPDEDREKSDSWHILQEKIHEDWRFLGTNITQYVLGYVCRAEDGKHTAALEHLRQLLFA